MRTDPYDALTPAQARRLRTVHRWLGVLLLVGLALGVVWFRFGRSSDEKDAALRRGATALGRAVTSGDGWDEAEAHFGHAARANVLDPYPIFALELARQLRSGELEVREPALRPVAESLARGDLAEARRQLAAVPEAVPGRAWFAQLLDDMAPSAGKGALP